MQGLRERPPAEIADGRVVYLTDYMTSRRVENGVAAPISLPPSDVLEYGLENGSTVIIRPSGTEPKIKIYYSLVGRTAAEADALEAAYSRACEALIGV